MWKYINRFVLKISFIRIYIYNFKIKIFIKREVKVVLWWPCRCTKRLLIWNRRPAGGAVFPSSSASCRSVAHSLQLHQLHSLIGLYSLITANQIDRYQSLRHHESTRCFSFAAPHAKPLRFARLHFVYISGSNPPIIGLTTNQREDASNCG
jgi:hypothetical protein